MSIQAMKQALEAILQFRNEPMLEHLIKLRATDGYVALDVSMDALRAAIEAAEKQEPIAWKDTMHTDHADGRKEHEPMLLGYDGWEKLPDGTDLYTTLPQPAIPDGWQAVVSEFIAAWDGSADPKAVGSTCRFIRAESALRDLIAPKQEEIK